MSKRIPILLEQAEREAEETTPRESSVTKASREFSGGVESEETFRKLKEKLLHFERWNDEAGLSSYELFDAGGNRKGGQPAVIGDFMKISLPGTGKDDWVEVIDILDTSDEMVITVNPSRNPTEKTDDESATSHFFSGDATNNFCLERSANALNIYVIGLSEKTNTDETKGALETVRNIAVANMGRFLGVQKAHWKSFCKSFLETGK